MIEMQLLFNILGFISPFLILWISVVDNKGKKNREELDNFKKEVGDLKLQIVKLESDKVSKEHLDRVISEVSLKIDSTNEKLNKLLGYMEKGGVNK